jgi:hypothetical protein
VILEKINVRGRENRDGREDWRREKIGGEPYGFRGGNFSDSLYV